VGQALWCDAKNAGHPMNAYAATIVTAKAATWHYCGPHTYDAFKKAMVIVGTERVCHLHYPPVGDIVLTCDRPVDARTGAPADRPAANLPPATAPLATSKAGRGTN
jgi:hypothetical protein